MNKKDELRQMRRLAESQTGVNPLQPLEKKTALPPITRKGGKHRRNKNKKTMKRRR